MVKTLPQPSPFGRMPGLLLKHPEGIVLLVLKKGSDAIF
ncbi:hypothetical protein NIASO_08940 [Niabella soli DSM 19437]|uniref:Uncharacterized protein n=1 Tax=Niabella soli DSM 19437 TaxID=929713 RepID=W0F383_9BACT|nr:hypothetical protein NIASO_08940 [Niabella soli DSM 19437]